MANIDVLKIESWEKIINFGEVLEWGVIYI